VQEKKLFLSRDRFGVKPLYFYEDATQLIFASEIQCIHKILGTAASPDKNVLTEIAKTVSSYHGTERTYLKNVFSLPGGSNMIFQSGQSNISRWYQLKKRPVPATLSEQAAEFRELLADACKIRLRSDVAVATCLSGGLDSGSITALIHSSHLTSGERRFNHYSHQSFLASFPGTFLDERAAAEALSQSIGNTLNTLNISPPARDEMENAMNACDGPMHSLAFYPIWKLYKFIKEQGITVTLDGQGPDEMLGGYRPLQEGLHASWQAKDFVWMKEIYEAYKMQGEFTQFSSRQFARNELKVFIKNRIKHLIGYNKGRAAANKESFGNVLEEHLYRQFFYNPLPAILNQYDRCSMASGVECRMPFMDYRLVEFVFSLPTKSKVGKGYSKLILRESMKGIVPEKTRTNRVKIGFNAPMDEWMKGSLKTFMTEVVYSAEFEQSEYFDAEAYKKKFEAFFRSDNSGFTDAYTLYPAFHLTWWLKKNNLS
jgi:asparagine synthase (glutamine-hydrolysing)